jgi:uncharacterized membrane protein YqhA
MLRRALGSTRFIVVIPIIGTFVASLGLLLYETMVIITTFIDLIGQRDFTPKAAKALAVDLIETVDIFLIAIVAYIMSLQLYSLFVDDSLPLPKWLQVDDLDDLKQQLVSVVIAVLGVLFLRQAVAWDGSSDLLRYGAALALMVVALTYYLTKLKPRDDE